MHNPSDVIAACFSCHQTCLSTVTGHCLKQGGEHAKPEHVKLMLDCAEICLLSAQFLIRGSPFHARACQLCAEICLRCAQDCERFQDEHMARCAMVCRHCTATCQAMAMQRAA